MQKMWIDLLRLFFITLRRGSAQITTVFVDLIILHFYRAAWNADAVKR